MSPAEAYRLAGSGTSATVLSEMETPGCSDWRKGEKKESEARSRLWSSTSLSAGFTV